jgi:DNA-binding response OmpR family regulator
MKGSIVSQPRPPGHSAAHGKGTSSRRVVSPTAHDALGESEQISMPSITVVLSTTLDAVLRQTAASRGRSTEDVVNTAVSQYLGWRDYDGSNSAIRVGNIELDPARRLVCKNSVLVRLTPTEFALLHFLMVHAGLPITHARLLGAVWGVEYRDEIEYLRTYVRQLRKKLEDDPAEPKYLLTDSHYGYRFADVTVDSNNGTDPRPAA